MFKILVFNIPAQLSINYLTFLFELSSANVSKLNKSKILSLGKRFLNKNTTAFNALISKSNDLRKKRQKKKL